MDKTTILYLIDEAAYRQLSEDLIDASDDAEETLKNGGVAFALARFAGPVHAVFGLIGIELTNDDALQIAYYCKKNGLSYEKIAALCGVFKDVDSKACVGLVEALITD